MREVRQVVQDQATQVRLPELAPAQRQEVEQALAGPVVLGLAQVRLAVQVLRRAQEQEERALVPLQVQLRRLPGMPITGAPRGRAMMQRKRRSRSAGPT